jgi:hypothetical protein
MTSSDSHAPREPSLIDIEVLDLGPLYEQAVEHYVSLDSSRVAWTQAQRKRLRIRTECRWGRIQFDETGTFLLNERGEGPREALGGTVRAYVALYAEMVPEGADSGFFESHPFCKVPIDCEAAHSFQALGILALEDFIRAKVPEMEAAYQAWLGILESSRNRARAAQQVRRAPQQVHA